MIFLAAILGLVVGSFLNAAVFRLKKKQSLVWDRSKCPHCQHVLAPLDLIPVVSFIGLLGRCRYCQKKISWQYPIIELSTALTFVLVGHNFEFIISNFHLWFLFAFASLLILIGTFDFKYYLILDKLVYSGAVLAIIYRLVAHGSVLDALWGALLVAGFFGLQYLASKGRWIGLGDVKFGLFLGLLFGFKLSIALLLIAYVLGALVGLTLIASGRKHLSSKMPFGSFLAAAGIITMIWGEGIVNWYLRLIGL